MTSPEGLDTRPVRACGAVKPFCSTRAFWLLGFFLSQQI